MKWIETKSDQLGWGRRAQGSITDPRWTDQPRFLPSTHPPLNIVPRGIGKKMILVERSDNELISDVIRSWRCHQNITAWGPAVNWKCCSGSQGKRQSWRWPLKYGLEERKQITGPQISGKQMWSPSFLCLLQERCFINIYEHWTLKWILHIGYLGKKH